MTQKLALPASRPLALALHVLLIAVSSAAAQSYTSTARYDVRKVEGWPVLVDKGLLDCQPELAGRTLELVGSQLSQIARRVHAGPLEKLRAIRIWVEVREPHHPCMAHHPDAEWLDDHDMNPNKSRCVELANARNFLDWAPD